MKPGVQLCIPGCRRGTFPASVPWNTISLQEQNETEEKKLLQQWEISLLGFVLQLLYGRAASSDGWDSRMASSCSRGGAGWVFGVLQGCGDVVMGLVGWVGDPKGLSPTSVILFYDFQPHPGRGKGSAQAGTNSR